MKLIIGLGNHPPKYDLTRHNIGFMMLDKLAEEFYFSDFKPEKKFFGKISVGQIASEKCILLKPETYMNISGKAVQALMRFYKIEPKDIIVIFDDLDTLFGKVKFKQKGSSGGHNGIKSLISSIGSQEFSRIKLGIENPNRGRIPAANFVLQKFTAEEMAEMNTLYGTTKEKLLDWMKSCS